MDTTLERDVEQVCNLVASKFNGNSRTILGIAGPPGSGKSTLAESVVRALNTRHADAPRYAALLPMDGYHLDNRILEDRGLLPRKGAPETFDAWGFCRAVQGLTGQEQEGFFPTFDRNLDLAIANAVAIAPSVPVVVVEGNYLLLNSDPWQSMQSAFSATVFLCPPMTILRERLIQRWIDHGLDPAAALARATQNDLPNAQTVIDQSNRADLHLQQGQPELAGKAAP